MPQPLTPAPELRGLVLAGGRSARMGRDKAALVFGGQALLDRTVALLDGLGIACHVSIRPDQVDDVLRQRYPLLVDPVADVGPAAGLLAAHAAAPGAAWLVVACDMPRLDQALLAALVARRDPACAGTAYRNPADGLPEPLCAIYEPATLARLAGEAARDAGKPATLSPRALLAADAMLIDPPRPTALASVNSPRDLDDMAGDDR